MLPCAALTPRLPTHPLPAPGMGNTKTLAYLEYVDNFTTSYCLDAVDLGVQMAGWAIY